MYQFNHVTITNTCNKITWVTRTKNLRYVSVLFYVICHAAAESFFVSALPATTGRFKNQTTKAFHVVQTLYVLSTNSTVYIQYMERFLLYVYMYCICRIKCEEQIQPHSLLSICQTNRLN